MNFVLLLMRFALAQLHFRPKIRFQTVVQLLSTQLQISFSSPNCIVAYQPPQTCLFAFRLHLIVQRDFPVERRWSPIIRLVFGSVCESGIQRLIDFSSNPPFHSLCCPPTFFSDKIFNFSIFSLTIRRPESARKCHNGRPERSTF